MQNSKLNGGARRWFQIHLSTAIVLMIAAGVLVRLNMFPAHDPSINYPILGWPIYAMAQTTSEKHWLFRDNRDEYSVLASRGTLPTEPASQTLEFEYEFSFGRWEDVWGRWLIRIFLVNVITWVLILGSIAFLFEWFIRRRQPPVSTAQSV